MYLINKAVGMLTNPECLGCLGFALAGAAALLRKARLARISVILSCCWLWFWSMPAVSRLVGASLERPYLVNGRVPILESYPVEDAIELHGGSMGIETNLSDYAEMWIGADRVWHAARLWKAGKAPIIYVTGGGVELSTKGLLMDFGIPTNSIVFADSPRNTEEEAKFISRLFADAKPQSLIPNPSTKPKVLVVTSAWHMKRTMLMYEKYAPNVEAIPAPCDFECSMEAVRPVELLDFVPDPLALFGNYVSIHEWVGILGYRIKWLVVRN